MPPKLPSRYRLEVRLGRDEDIEEWFATDVELDRPVLIRLLGPESTPKRRQSFLGAYRQASRVNHSHVAGVFAADAVSGAVYAITEWGSGATLADLLNGGGVPTPEELLDTATNLADGLAALHAEGVIHGTIDATAVLHTHRRTPKLGGFGRRPRARTTTEDVRDLATTIETALTGLPAGTVAPSELAHSVTPDVDEVLRMAAEGSLEAREMADLLREHPCQPRPQGAFRWTWRRTAPIATLAAAAVLLLWIGNAITAGPEPTLTVPTIPLPTLPPQAVREITDPPRTPEIGEPSLPEGGPVALADVFDFDPLGDGEEHPGRVRYLTDGDPDTTWRTEYYYTPLQSLKAGVGVAFEVEGSPSLVELTGLSEGTAFRVLWAGESLGVDVSEWEMITEERAGTSTMRLPLPEKPGGYWILWLIDLPVDAEGYRSHLAEVSFSS